jgi:hypothetical protein
MNYPQPPQPQYVYVPVAPTSTTKTNGLAVAGMVLGIIWIYWIGSILAVIFGHIALHQISNSEYEASRGATRMGMPVARQSGRGMAIAAVTLGWIGVGTLLIVILAAIGASGS